MSKENIAFTNKIIKEFKIFLLSKKLSRSSIKNYTSDVRRYLKWISKHINLVTPEKVTDIKFAEEYKEHLLEEGTSQSSINRSIAALKNLGEMVEKTYSISNPLQNLDRLGVKTTENPLNNYIKVFTKYLKEEQLSNNTIKAYKSDIGQYLNWIVSTTSSTRTRKLLTERNIRKYLKYLSNNTDKKYSTIERKSKSLLRLLEWSRTELTSKISDITASKPSLAHPTRGRDQSQKHLFSQFSRSIPIAWQPLLSLTLLLVFSIALSIFGYRQFSKDKVILSQAYPSTPTKPGRQLSFQGRLEDSTGTPITASTNLLFKLFNNAETGTELYSSGTCTISPDADGIFSVQIGNDCGDEIGSQVFTENTNVWLEVTVASETLSPRQQIATVAYALNSETLQGLPLSSTLAAIRSTVVAMNRYGEVVLGEQSPTLKSVSGTFGITGPSISITTATGTNGSIALAPDGTGSINLIGNTTTSDFINITNSQLTTGALIRGYVGNNNTGYNLLELNAGTTEENRFVVDVSGNATLSGTLSLAPILQIDAGTCNASSEGKQYYDATQNKYYFCDGSSWVEVGGGSSLWTDGGTISYLTETTDDLAVGGSTLTSPFSIDVSTNTVRIGNASTGNGTLALYASDSDTGSIIYNTSDQFNFTGGDVKLDQSLIVTSDVAINGGDLTSSAVTFNLLPNPTTLNIGASATLLSIGSTTGTTRINNNLDVDGTTNDIAGTLNLSGGALTSTGALTVTPQADNNLNIVLSGTGDLAVNTDDLYVDTSLGYIGIGTATPQNLFDVTGSSASVRIDSTGYILDFTRNSTNYIRATDASGAIGFIAGGSGTDVLITSDGNVGIGDNTPDGLLDIEPTGAVTTASYGINLSNLTTNITTDAINKYGAYITSTGAWTGSTGTDTNNYGLYVDTVSGADNNYGAYFANNIGIGDTTPDHTLDVDGNIGLTAGGYINWEDTTGTSGYGFRDNSGAMEFKNSAGTWAAIGTGSGDSYWRLNFGTLSPINDTFDLLVGSNATESARAAFLNIDDNAPGTPTATVSAGSAGGAYISADGTFATTTAQELTLGSSETGNINLNPGGSTAMYVMTNGDIGIGTGVAIPQARLELNSPTATKRALIVQTTDNSTVNNLIEFQDSGGSARGYVTGDLRLVLNPTTFSDFDTLLTAGTTYTDTVGSGELAQLNSIYNASTNTGSVNYRGLNVLVNNTSSTGISQSDSSVTAGRFSLTHSGTGILSNAKSADFYLNVGASAGTLTNAYGGYFNSITTSGGTITNAYGVYIGNQTAGGTNYALYTDGSTESYFGGNVGIGITSPTAFLDLAAATTSQAQLHLTSSAGVDPATPNSGDLWWNGTSLYFYNGSINSDLLGDSIWTDGGTYIYPTNGEVLGNSASAGTNKVTGLYLADSSPLYFGTDNDINYSFSGTTLAVTTGTNDINFDANTFFIDGSTDRVGIGTTTPGSKLQVNTGATGTKGLILKAYSTIGSAAFTGTGLDDCTSGGTFTDTAITNYKVEIDGTGTPDTFKWSDDGGSTWDVETVAITGAAQTLNNGVTITFGATTGHTLADYWLFTATPQSADLAQWQNPAGTVLGVIDADGNVGIGTTTPAWNLEIKGDSDHAYLGINSGSSKEAGIIFQDVGTSKYEIYKNPGNDFSIYDYTRGAEVFGIEDNGNMRLMANGGNVGIGTTAPNAKLEVHAADIAGDEYSEQFRLYDTNSVAANIGAIINLGGTYTGTTVTEWAAIGSGKDNAVDGEYGGYLTLSTRVNGAALLEKVRITSSGNVGIGTTNPSQKLDVSGNVIVDGWYQYNKTEWAVNYPAAHDDLISLAGSMPGYDVFEWATVNSVEYHDGSSWVTWSTSFNNLFDNNVFTNVTIDNTHKKFRFVIDSGGWGCPGLFSFERSYVAGAVTGTITIETDDNTSFTSPTTHYTGSSFTFGEMWHVSDQVCCADRYFRVTLDTSNPTGLSWDFNEISATSLRGGSSGANISPYKKDYTSAYVSEGLAVGYSSGQSLPSNGLVVAGKIGIGNTSPTYTLDVTGDIRATDTGNPGITIGDGSTGFLKIGSSTIFDNNETKLSFDPDNDGTAEVTFANDGNVDISGHLGLADDNASSWQVIASTETYTGSLTADATKYGLYNIVSSSITENAYHARLRGTYNLVVNSNGYTANQVMGIYNYARNDATAGTVDNMYGNHSISINNTTGTVSNSYGIQSYSRNDDGTMTNSYGLYGYSHQYVAGGSIGSSFGVRGSSFITAGTISNGYGGYFTSTGATNNYGIYVSSDQFGVYSAGGTNYFSGSVGIGTTAPSRPLEIYNSGAYLMEFDRTSSSYVDTVYTAGVSYLGTNNDYFFLGYSTNQQLIIQDSATNSVVIHSISNNTDFKTNWASTSRVYTNGIWGNTYNTYYTNESGGAYKFAHTGSAYDLAEWIPVDPSDNLQSGELLCSIPSQEDALVTRCSQPISSNLVGAVSTKPWTVIGENRIGEEYYVDKIEIALSGRVPMKVFSINETIEPGDPITSSYLPGFGKKSTQAGQTVGQSYQTFPANETCPVVESLESIDWPNDEGRNEYKPCYQLPISSLETQTREHLIAQAQLDGYSLNPNDYIYVGKIMVSANVSYSDPDLKLTDTGDLNIETNPQSASSSTNFTLTNTQNNQLINRVSAFAQSAIANLKAGSIVAQEIATDSLTIEGLSLSEYIAKVVTDLLPQQQLISPLTEVDTLKTNLISPIASDSAITLEGSTIITDYSNTKSEQPLLKVEGEINAATISARTAVLEEITATKIKADEIEVGSIIADNIVGLEDKVATLAGETINQYYYATASAVTLSDEELTSITNRIKDKIASLAENEPTAEDIPQEETIDSIATNITEATDSANLANSPLDLPDDLNIYSTISADTIIVNDYFAVIGQATITTLNVNNTLYTNSIQSKCANPNTNTGCNDVLSLQPLGGTIKLAANTMIIDSLGNVTINGDLQITGNLYANNANFNTLSLGTSKEATESALGKLLTVYNEEGIEVATIDASGSASLKDLTTQLITIASSSEDSQSATASALAQAISTETTSNATAGKTTLKALNTELTIESPHVDANSLIYLTPTSSTFNQVLYVKTKKTCQATIYDLQSTTCTPSFTVAIGQPIPQDITFNWWVIRLLSESPHEMESANEPISSGSQ